MDEFLQTYQPIATFAKDIITIISLTIAAIIAFLGLSAWKKQLVGSGEYELAKRILKATYHLRDALENIRSAFITAGEADSAVKETGLELDKSSPDYINKSNVAAIEVRWKKVVSSVQELQIEASEAEALWGKDIREKILEIRSVVGELYAALRMYLSFSSKPFPRQAEQEIVQKFEKIVYKMSLGEGEDEYSARLLEKVNLIEGLVRPYLKRNHR